MKKSFIISGPAFIKWILGCSAIFGLNNPENGSFKNRENLQYKKTADLVLLSVFMSTNGKPLVPA